MKTEFVYKNQICVKPLIEKEFALNAIKAIFY